MLLELPSSLACLLSLFRGCFTQPTFETFCTLTVGLLTRVRARTVTGMLVASGMARHWHHCRAHRFFSRARWSLDRLGLVALALVERRFVAAGEPLLIAIDDTLIRRFGPKVFGRCLNYDGASSSAGHPAGRIAWGNSWVVAGVVVELPFLARPICLPVLFRLWRPGAGPTQVELATELVTLAAQALPERRFVVLGDGSYGRGALAPQNVPDNVSLVVRARRDLRIHRPAPPRRAGQTGRPRLRGKLRPALRELAASGRARWRRERVSLYGQDQVVEVCSQHGLWWQAWRDSPAKAVAVRDRRAPDQIDLVVLASDPELSDRRILELYSKRWSIEVAFRDAKQLVGAGEAQNRTRRAVERTAPFGFLALTLAVCWYALAGHGEGDVRARRERAPWYRTKRQPSVEDMLVKLRRAIIRARFSATMGPRGRRLKPSDLAEAWEMAVA
jgi:hypothetical protein